MSVTLRRIADAIEAILEDKVPEIPWQYAVLGPVFPKTLTGYICCNEIKYDPFVKSDNIAVADFAIQIICPNTQKGDATAVENYAMKVRETLGAERTLDGWAEDSSVQAIVFGTPAGSQNIGIAVIDFTVKYEE
jgi:hypothetical protein|nr:MAG TPA: Minor tail protein U Alpha-Beta fold, VIRAL PROTEIN [Caudoviricetes sp.]